MLLVMAMQGFNKMKNNLRDRKEQSCYVDDDNCCYTNIHNSVFSAVVTGFVHLIVHVVHIFCAH